ncbi:MAG: CPBP family intramembrane metalloprotease [Bacteroidales bacterium]|nr:CPBP family intramembrane metalloprotease [Bacteroidales bacterium]
MKKRFLSFLENCMPGYGLTAILVVLFFLGSVAAGLFVGTLGIGSTSLTYLLSMLPPFLLAWAVSASSRIGISPIPIHQPHYGALTPLTAIAVMCVAVVALGVVVEPVANLMPMSENLRRLMEEMFSMDHPLDLFIATSLLAPICEELLCRGLVMRGLMRKGTPLTAILISAAVFGLLHANFQQGVTAFAFGLFLGWVYYRSGSIVACMAVHFTNNTLAQVMAVLFPDAPADATYADVMPEVCYILLYIVSVAVLALTVYVLHRKLDKGGESFNQVNNI